MQTKLTSIVAAGFLLSSFAQATATVDWTTTWSAGPSGFARPIFVKLDGDGNILTVGHINGAAGDPDLLIQKRTSEGGLLWTTTYDNSDRQENPTAMGVDADGNVVVTAYSWSGVGFERWLVLKVTSEGSVAWANSAGVGVPGAVHVNPDGTSIVTGYTSSPAKAFDMCTIKYAADGSRVWTSRLNGPFNGDDYVHDLAVDATGNIYLAASVQKNANRRDTRVVKLNPNGNQMWIRPYTAGPTSDSLGRKIAIHASGGCVVAGEQHEQGNVDTFDIPVSRYDADGNLLWRRIFDGPDHLVDRAKALKIDNAGNAWLLSASHSLTSRDDMMLVRYSPTGDKESRRFANGVGDSDEPMGLAINPADGTIYIAGGSTSDANTTTSVVLKFHSLSKQWTLIEPGPYNSDFAFDVAIDSSNRAIVVGQRDNSTYVESLIWRVH
ncbi:MAG: hypothetical protein ACAH95_01330 [Fimbriimonas sp.]